MTDIRTAFMNANGNGNTNGSPKTPGGGKQTIEKIYQKKSQLEHILLRPDTYIGSVEYAKEQMWIFDLEKKRMVQKEISYVPGLYKIFDEILVNAADNKQRDSRMNTIKVDINQETNTICISNNGKGIPVVMHQVEKMYVPTLIFGHLLTSSNYNDEEQKVTGGRNGYGAKLCNIFSDSFTVETASKADLKKFKQTWSNNMSKASEPQILKHNGEDYTTITFAPDLKKFKMEKLDDDIVGLMSRRAYDVAASTRGVTVFLNGEKLPIKSFKDYIELYIKEANEEESGGAQLKVIYEVVNERWEVGVTLSDRGFQQVSFVNSIATTKGGRHVDHVTDMMVKQLTEVLKKKNKGGINIKPFQIKNHMWVFVNCLIVNPTFDSQTKENMTLQAKSFGSKCPLTEKFINNLAKSGIVESVLSWAKFKAQTDLAKTSGKKNAKIKGVPKLEDANDAGTKNSLGCTLILTEGDSAKTLAVSGLGVVGRDAYGVFPLRGKLLNVREATHKQILENAEINNLIKIIGLQYKKKYLTMDDMKTLRYGKVMIMTDQDQDGSHIKGLLINFIHTNWPELLRLPFLEEFITPIVKATKKNQQELSFFSLPEFEEWKANTPNNHTFNVKYYKGLGTSTSKEAKEYFQNMDRHRILFKYDGSPDDDNIIMAFSKKTIDQRKEWLTSYMDECKQRKLEQLPERYLYTKDTKEVSYTEFINLELVLFSNADNIRSIPCVVDGFKPGQRKIMYTCFKRNDKREVKVAQLAGSVAEMSAYHHGEVSLCSTIVNLAQNYVGSNNINLLYPGGQFGTRLSGGKDSASPRYIFTMMTPLTRLIFHPHDDPLLQYQLDDNQRIEPVFYVPIIPMVLVNGCEGIGTGWSTKIPNYNPRDIVDNIRRMIQGESLRTLLPWYKNFRGSIEFLADQRYISTGVCSILERNKLEISELPIGTWTQNYKENVLDPLLNGSEKQKAILTDYKEYNTDTTVRFVLTFVQDEFDTLSRQPGGFYRELKLTSLLSTGNLHAFDRCNFLTKYEQVDQIFRDFYDLRLEFYDKRKRYLEGKLQAECDRLADQARFILEKCERTLVVENKKRKVMVDELIARGYRPDPVAEWKRSINLDSDEPVAEQPEGEEEVEDVKPGKVKKEVDPEVAFKNLSDVKKFDYLLGMSMWMLTEEKKNELLKQRDTKIGELKILKEKTKTDLWVEDLDAFVIKLDEVEKKERDEEMEFSKKQMKLAGGQPKGRGGDRGGSSKLNSKKAIDDTKPSRFGELVKFKVTEDIMKKLAQATRVKANAKIKAEAGEPVTPGEGVAAPAATSGDGTPAEDEFDALINEAKKQVKKEPKPKKEPKEPKAPKEPKVKKEPKTDGLKQTKLTFKQDKKKKKKFDSDDEDDDEVNFSDFDNSGSTSNPERTSSRRAATKKIDYSLLDGGDEEEEEDEEFGDDDVVEVKPAKSADEVQYLSDTSSIDSPVVKKKPAPAKRKLGPKVTDDAISPPVATKPTTSKRPRKIIMEDDSEEEKPKKIKKKKKKYASGSDMSDSDSDFAI